MAAGTAAEEDDKEEDKEVVDAVALANASFANAVEGMVLEYCAGFPFLFPFLLILACIFFSLRGWGLLRLLLFFLLFSPCFRIFGCTEGNEGLETKFIHRHHHAAVWGSLYSLLGKRPAGACLLARRGSGAINLTVAS